MSLQVFVGHASTTMSVLVPLPVSHHPAVSHHHHIPHHQILTPTPRMHSLGIYWPNLKTPSFPHPQQSISPIPAHLKMVALCRWLQPCTGVPRTGAWATGRARTGDSLHPAEFKQHSPLKDEADTSSALPDHNKSLAPGSVHF